MEQLNDYAVRYPAEGVVTEFLESLAKGHITGSAWVVNGDGTEGLLTHHRKLDCWLQLGGHADGESDVLVVAIKEAEDKICQAYNFC